MAQFNDRLQPQQGAQAQTGLCRKPETPITLLEASDNFFAYEPVLKALQASSEATLPMQDLLQVDSSGQVSL